MGGGQVRIAPYLDLVHNKLMHISDLTALDCLAKVEGSSWKAVQRAQPGPFSYFGWLAGWHAKQKLLVQHPEYADYPISDFMDNPGDGMLYGEGGWSRYVVQADGEVVLLGWSCREAKQELARAAGIRVLA